jgi:hypothetical protein
MDSAAMSSARWTPESPARERMGLREVSDIKLRNGWWLDFAAAIQTARQSRAVRPDKDLHDELLFGRNVCRHSTAKTILTFARRSRNDVTANAAGARAG